MKLIVARNIHNGIGLDNQLPWRCKEDLQWFKEFTLNKTIVMGRKTFESVGKLPNRNILVLSRTQTGEGFISSLAEAPEDSIIAGGAEVYKEALELDLVDEMYVTVVNDVTQCDTFFPTPDRKSWYCFILKKLSDKAYVLVYTKRKL